MKDVYCVSTEQHLDMKSSVSRSKNTTILQAQCASALSCSNMWKSSYPHSDRFARFFMAATVKLKIFVINEPDFFTIGAG